MTFCQFLLSATPSERQNFINEPSAGLLRPLRAPIKLSGPHRKGVVERGLEGSNPRKELLKEALKAQNSEGVAEVAWSSKSSWGVGCCLRNGWFWYHFGPFRRQGCPDPSNYQFGHHLGPNDQFGDHLRPFRARCSKFSIGNKAHQPNRSMQRVICTINHSK